MESTIPAWGLLTSTGALQVLATYGGAAVTEDETRSFGTMTKELVALLFWGVGGRFNVILVLEL